MRSITIIFFILISIFLSSLAQAILFVPTSFEAQIKQSYVSILTKEKKETEGVIKYLASGNLWFEVTTPISKKLIFITNEANDSWYYNPPKKEGMPGFVRISNKSDNSLSVLFDLLKLGLVDNPQYKVKCEVNSCGLTFSDEAIKKVKIKDLKLNFKDTQYKFENLNSIVFSQVDEKNQITIDFKAITSKTTLKKDDFVFKVPANTRISN